MNWEQVIVGVVSALVGGAGGGGIVATLFKTRLESHKQKSDIQKAINDQLMMHVKACDEALDAANKERDLMRKEINQLRQVIVATEGAKLRAHLQVRLNENGHLIILAADAAAGVLSGYVSDELVGREVQMLIPFRYRNAHFAKSTEVTKGKRSLREEPLDTVLLTKQGVEIPVEIKLSKWEQDGQIVWGADIGWR